MNSLSLYSEYSRKFLDSVRSGLDPQPVIDEVATSRRFKGKLTQNLLAFAHFIQHIGKSEPQAENKITARDLLEKTITRIKNEQLKQKEDHSAVVTLLQVDPLNLKTAALTLPRDLLAQIASYLDDSDFAALKRTSRFFYAMSPHLMAKDAERVSRHLTKLLNTKEPRAIEAFVERCPDTTYSASHLDLTIQTRFPGLCESVKKIQAKFPNASSLTFQGKYAFPVEELLEIYPRVGEFSCIATPPICRPLPCKFSDTLQILKLNLQYKQEKELTALLTKIITSCPGLQKLVLYITYPVDWKSIPRLTFLQTLSIDGGRSSHNLHDLMDWLSDCRTLTSLTFSDIRWICSDDSVQNLNWPPSLKNLRLTGAETNLPLTNIAHQSRLARLVLDLHDNYDFNFEALALPPSLERFTIGHSYGGSLPTPLLLSKLHSCKELRIIDIHNCLNTVEEQGFDESQIFSSVEALNIMGSPTELVKKLHLFPNLTQCSLSLERGPLADDDKLGGLTLSPGIEELELELDEVASIRKIPQIVSKFPNIKQLQIHYLNPVTCNQVDLGVLQMLSKSHPNLEWNFYVKNFFVEKPIRYGFRSEHDTQTTSRV